MPKKFTRIPLAVGDENMGAVFNLKKHGGDLVYAATEDMLHPALILGKKLGVPVIGHTEFFPPWRIDPAKQAEWGVPMINWPKHDAYYVQYKQMAKLLSRCDHVTIGAETLKWNVWNAMDMFGIGKRIKLETMHLGINHHVANEVSDNIPVQNAIILIGRLVPQKKFHYLISAVGRLGGLTYKPEIWVIGTPQDRQYQKTMETIADTNEVIVKCLGEFSGPKKWEYIKQAKFAFQAWGSIPPGEALWCEKPCICYETPYMVEMYGSYVEYVPWDDELALAYLLADMLDDEAYLKRRGHEGKRAMQSLRCHIWPLDFAATHFHNLLERLINEQ